MHGIRFACGVGLGGIITATLAFLASTFAALSLTPLAQKTPDWWGKLILHLCYRGCWGKAYHRNPRDIPKPFNGFTLIVSNHPHNEYYPGILGVVSELGLSPAIVSKEENLKGWIGLVAGRPLKRIGRGAFISQNGGETSRKRLREAVNACSEMLLFADKHRPSKEALQRDQKRYPNSGLTKLCVPRAGGVHSILTAAIATNRQVRVINLTWHVTENAIYATWEDVTHQFVTPHALGQTLISEKETRNALLGLWHEKEVFAENHP